MEGWECGGAMGVLELMKGGGGSRGIWDKEMCSCGEGCSRW